ncbi:type II toxin-antitoxin system VapC family toxin [Nostoc sp. 'Peltigera malacea cyanobiont' DB3992]|uniref:type II toxin-antitoxin system VapC family toxin n=1 Tax=Nostoc sp. 'Peltigera malacea cyanobiont' DB3992 TaxID=1206980 RepID=UPI000C04C613|nr:type II toxin-antitoxin system VapC family toxin [Nostoc sp. 'Peltigera malacea cyanobiont' DB3992]PHM10153.1 nuclease [Nostoc sp. 'Peltigera malacea cyanobiont' DB3992]
MSLWVLDTDHVSLLLERHPFVSRRVSEVGAEVAISIVTVQELFNGWVVRINSARKVEDVVRLYGKLSRTVALFGRVRVLDFDDFAGETFVRLRLENPTLSKQRLQKDMRIAAIALVNDAVVVTRNYRDFSQVPSLKIEDWSRQDG